MAALRPHTAVLALALAATLGVAYFWSPSKPSPTSLETGATATTTAPAAEPQPLGEKIYSARLSVLAGEPLDVRELEATAASAARTYLNQLQDLARRQGAEDWRTLFAELEQDHPPTREAVLDAYRDEIARQEEFLTSLDLFPVPERAIRVLANDNPVFRRYFSLAMYLDGQLAVTLEPADDGPGGVTPGQASDYLVNHCRVCIPPLVAHEVAPGHHVAYSAANRLIADSQARVVAHRTNSVFHEGWGLYAELLMLELGYYRDDAQKLGAVRLLFLRALRAQVDAALHRGEITSEEAKRRYRDEVGLSPPTAGAEVARHLKDPGLKASYFIGLEQILALRRQVLGPNPTPEALGDFHRRLLGRPLPIPAVARKRFDVELASPFTQGDPPA